MEKFFNLIYRLRFIKRWATSFSTSKESVAEHNFSVSIIAHLLSLINNELNNTDINADEVAVSALYHDGFESFTSHIIAPIRTNEFKESFEDMRKLYTSRLIASLPDMLKNKIENLNVSNNKEISEIIRTAKTMDCYFYCKFQVKIGNSDFKIKLKLFEEEIEKLKKNYNYVNWFFENLCDFENSEITY